MVVRSLPGDRRIHMGVNFRASQYGPPNGSQLINRRNSLAIRTDIVGFILPVPPWFSGPPAWIIFLRLIQNSKGGRVIALLQRVTEAAVHVNGEQVASIGPGIMALVGVQKNDSAAQADRLLERLLSYRIFPDDEGRMNLDLRQSGGELLLVPQFTLAANTRKGNRPSFTSAAPPDEGKRQFEYVCERALQVFGPIGTGIFGADMKVSLVNDGPVTFWLEVTPA